jgi:hypothetical protein
VPSRRVSGSVLRSCCRPRQLAGSRVFPAFDQKNLGFSSSPATTAMEAPVYYSRSEYIETVGAYVLSLSLYAELTDGTRIQGTKSPGERPSPARRTSSSAARPSSLAVLSFEATCAGQVRGIPSSFH